MLVQEGMSTDLSLGNGHVPAEPSPPPLPTDVSTLHALIAELLDALQKSQHECDGLRHRLDQLLRRLYGPKAERFDPNQPWLFADLTTVDEPRPAAVPPPDEAPDPRSKRKGHGRKPLPKDLPRRRQEHGLPEAQRVCPCCGVLCTKFGEDISEQLDYRPASLFVWQHVRFKYACPQCHDYVTAAPVPVAIIDKGLPGPGLLAQIGACKYADHCVQGEAVYEMRVGLSWPGCRIRPQTAGMLLGLRATVVSDSGKGKARPCQVGAGKTNASEPLMKCRNRKAMSKPGSGGCPGISAEATCLLSARHPALRRRESGTGSYTEPWNLSSRCEGRSPSGGPMRT